MIGVSQPSRRGSDIGSWLSKRGRKGLEGLEVIGVPTVDSRSGTLTATTGDPPREVSGLEKVEQGSKIEKNSNKIEGSSVISGESRGFEDAEEDQVEIERAGERGEVGEEG